ncbi:hypothetical protein HY468_05885 [Candidatus Roizmanbacteria bacterium]|nr:hypothetical protein [Candidatus Roizmanbacteria bacterium]
MTEQNRPSIEEVIGQVDQIRLRRGTLVMAAEELARELQIHKYDPEVISKTVADYVRKIEPDLLVEQNVESPHDVLIEAGYMVYLGTNDQSLLPEGTYIDLNPLPGETGEEYVIRRLQIDDGQSW